MQFLPPAGLVGRVGCAVYTLRGPQGKGGCSGTCSHSGILWCGRRRRGRCGRDSPPPYFVTTLSPLPHHSSPFPSSSLPSPPSPPPFPFPSPPPKVLESKKTLMKHVISALQGEEFGMKVAALKCILFWSRSPQQLRTTLIDYEAWRPLQEVCV